MNRKTPRVQNLPTNNQNTVHLTLWVNPIVKEALQRTATREGLTSMSQRTAKGNITRKTPQLTALIDAVEQHDTNNGSGDQ
jgi:hypothetical protein